MQLFSTPWRKSELGTNGLILMFQDPVKIKSARFLKSCKVFDALDIFFPFMGSQATQWRKSQIRT